MIAKNYNKISPVYPLIYVVLLHVHQYSTYIIGNPMLIQVTGASKRFSSSLLLLFQFKLCISMTIDSISFLKTFRKR